MSFDFSSGTIWRRWCDNASKSPTSEVLVHWRAGEAPFRWTWCELIRTAEIYSAALKSRGIKRGDVCAIIAKHNHLLYPIYLGCVRSGAIPTILAYHNPRLHPEKFREGIEGMSKHSGLDWILTEQSLENALAPVVGNGLSTIKGLQFPFERDGYLNGVTEDRVDGEAQKIGASDPLLLQHSSGTTGLQKPVLLSNRAVLDHVTQYAAVLGVSNSDKIVSWLPLYHDMGLIAAFHLPLALGISSIQIDPFEWVLAPSLFLEAMSKEGATLAWLPNFAFSMMADKIKDEDLEGINLDSCRMLVNCSEPVRMRDLEKFFNRFEGFGLRRECLSSCYAMAETTFAVTQTPPGREPETLAVDPQMLSRGIASRDFSPDAVKLCVSSGKLLPGCEVRIVNSDAVELADNCVGEVLIKTPWMFDGYRNYPDKTAAAIRDGWYHSGDYGFRSGEEFYIIGRKKDVIIVAGNNIYPEDVEAAVKDVSGLIPGRIVAFGEEDAEFGSERLAIAAETALSDDADCRRLKIEIVRAGMAVALTITNVYLVPPRFLVKSSAGKLSRSANKQRVLSLLGNKNGLSGGIQDDLSRTESSDLGRVEAR